MLTFVNHITCSFTNDIELGDFPQIPVPVADVVNYLNASPRNAIVITDLDEASGECVAGSPVYVLRGAGEDLNNFYFGPFPAEDPGDANGGDLTAEQALAEALDALCS